MSKELFISSTPHETKVAIVEEDQLAEIYFERENEYTLAGSIYKGRVTRVLPGMQSAFVDLGLERDAFLYVSDFFEDQEEYDAVVTLAEDEVTKLQPRPVDASETRRETTPTAAPLPPEPAQASSDRDDDGSRRWRGRRRRRGGRGRSRDDSRPAPAETSVANGPASEPVAAPPPSAATVRRPYEPMILPGESISKYRRRAETPETAVAAPSVETVAPAPNEPSSEERRDPFQASGSFEIVGGYAGGREEYQAQTPGERAVEPLDRQELAAAVGGRQGESVDVAKVPPAVSPSGMDLIEEETAEEEENDFSFLAGEQEEDSFEDLEEHTLDQEGIELGEGTMSGGAELGQAVDESNIERVATGNFETEPPGYESDEEEDEEETEGGDTADEMLVEAGEEMEEVEEEVGRAEVRASGATAGLQQRSAPAESGPARRRGRRGGRGMHGGRRNVQHSSRPRIADLLKEGQEILVQIAKEPIGKKGARITSHIALPGRFLVYMPTVDHIGVSRKIASDEERQRLKRILSSERNGAHGGFIVRTAAAGASEDDLRADIRFLINLWTEIRNRAESGNAPALIYHDLNVVERILRDQVTQTFTHIWVDTEPEYERVLRFVSRFQPSLVKRVKLYAKETPLYEQFNIQDEINKALKSKVWLKSGGYIVINQTEALVAIDINTGKYVGKTGRLEDTIVKTNVEAIKEIVRQVRLRDLGGIIVIDFIDMDERRNRQKVMQALEEALRGDRAPSKVLSFNDFGLVAITRKRVKQSLERTLGAPCTYCTGTGLIKSVATVCNEIYVEMRKMAKHLEQSEVLLRVHPDVGKALKANGARLLQELEELTNRTVIVKGDASLHQEQFDIN